MEKQLINRDWYVQIVTTFFIHLQNSFKQLDQNLSIAIRRSISRKLFGTLDIHVGHNALFSAILKIFYPKKGKSRAFFKPWQKTLGKIWVKVSSEKTSIASFFLDILTQTGEANIQRLANEIINVKHDQLEKALQNAENFSQVNKKKCIVINSLFTPSWSPIFRALQKNGWEFAPVIFSDLKEFSSYTALITEKIPTPYKYITDLFGGLVFMSTVRDSAIFLSGEAYHFANWDGENVIILYSLMSCVAKTIQTYQTNKDNNLHYLMYDGLKPVATNAMPLNMLSVFYEQYMKSVDKIIYNSNKAFFGDFVENTYDVKAKRIHFFRYSEEPKNPKPRLSFGKNNDEYHMVCITACLDGSLDALRGGVVNLVRMIVHQGIHFHYYTGDSQKIIDAFIATIQPFYRHFFHPYPVNTNQEELVNELHQYHIGLNPSDYLLMSNAICVINDRKYQDAMRRFTQSTCPTSNLTYIAAGLPVVSTVDADNLLCETMFSLTYSEFKNLKNYLKKINLPEYCKKADEIKHIAWVKNHIHKLIDFVES